MKVFLNAAEVAKLMKVNRATVVRWAQKGLLKGAMRIEGKHRWRIPLSAYEELVKKHKK